MGSGTPNLRCRGFLFATAGVFICLAFVRLLPGQSNQISSAFTVGSNAVPSQSSLERGVATLPYDMRLKNGFSHQESAGLFVGIRSFEDHRFVEVPYAVDDAVDLAYVFSLDLELINPAKIVLALAGEPHKEKTRARLEALLNAGALRVPASQRQIYDQLEKQGNASNQRGIFVLALATHGFNHQGEDYLVASDSTYTRRTRTGLAVRELLEDAAKANAARRIVLLDACREQITQTRGISEVQSAMGQSLAAAIGRASGQIVLSCTVPKGYCYDDKLEKNGVFSRAVVDGLLGHASSDEQGFITVESLAQYVDNETLNWLQGNRRDHLRDRGISWEGPLSLLRMPLALRRKAPPQIPLSSSTREKIIACHSDPIFAAITGEQSPTARQQLIRDIESELSKLKGEQQEHIRLCLAIALFKTSGEFSQLTQ